MPEPTDPRAADLRAEQALRSAFTRYADRLDPEPLEIAPRRRRGRALLAVAAAAVLVAAVVGSVAVLTPDNRPAAPATGGTPSATPTPTTSFEARSVSYGDVEVQVPADWVDARPTGTWCLVDEPPAPGPYVETNPATVIFETIGCGGSQIDEPGFPQYRQELWRPHLAFRVGQGAPADGTYDFRGWTLTVRTVGTQRISLLTDSATTPLAAEIVGSARRVERGAAGCDATSPIQRRGQQSPPPADLAALTDVTSVAVCQYVIGASGPGLLGSRTLTGEAAQGLRDAVLAGPTVDRSAPDRCRPRDDETAVVLRFAQADGEPLDVYSYYESCADAGFDDGTTLRALTSRSCPPLFGGRVLQGAFYGNDTYVLCVPGGKRIH